MALALLGFVVVLFAAAGCGMAVLRLLRVESGGAAEPFVIGSAIGLGLLSYAVLAAGLLGYLRFPVLLALVILQAILGARSLAGWVADVKDGIHHRDTETQRAKGQEKAPVGDRPGVEHSRPSSPAPPAPRIRPSRSPLCLRVSVLNRIARYTAIALVLYCLFIVGCTLVGALAPPNGDDWDSLAYHLAAPKIYLAHGRIRFIPYDSHTNFPFTMEMLYTLGLSYGGAAGAKLFHWAAGWLTALGIAVFARRLFPGRRGAETLPIWAPPLAAALFLSIPQVQWQATTAYIDLGTTLYQFLALVAFVYAVAPKGITTETQRHREGSRDVGQETEKAQAPGPLLAASGHPSSPPSVSPCLRGDSLRAWPAARDWLIVCGLMSGWAMGTKMTALLPFGLLVLAAMGWACMSSGAQAFGRSGVQEGSAVDAAIPNARPQGIEPEHPNARMPDRLNARRCWQGVAWLLGVGVLTACPWYIKSYLWTNNPVYPFFYHLFPYSVGWTAEAEKAYQHEQGFFGLGHGLLALLMAPWNLAMQGWAFFTVPSRWSPPGSLPYFDGLRRGGLSATFLALVPLAVFTRRWDRRLTGLIVYALALLVPWFFLSQQSRYLLPVVAPLAVVAVAVLANLESDLPRWAAGAFVALSLFLHATWGWQQVFLPAYPVVSGQITPDEYLRRTFPLYDAAQFINTLPPGSKIAIYQETRGFYLNRDYLWANPLQNTLIPYGQLASGKQLVRFLKERLGVTHVLLNRGLAAGSEHQGWYLLLQDAIQHGDLVPVFNQRGVEIYAIPTTL